MARVEVPLADIPQDRPRQQLARPAGSTEHHNRMARVEVPLADIPEDPPRLRQLGAHPGGTSSMVRPASIVSKDLSQP